MVRLKDSRVRKVIDKLLISIPYGAIKRINTKVSDFFRNKFQFLMVRLKENLYIIQIMLLHISIPYGAIKRNHK